MNKAVFLRDMEQEGEAWKLFRSKGIGSSDVSLLIDPKPSFDRTIGSLWNDRVGYERFKFVSNIHTERGKRLEGYVRDETNKILGTNFQPICVLREDAPYLRASLDGYDPEHNAILEIKNPSDNVADKYIKEWEELKGQPIRVPYNYYLQIQYQLLVSGASYAYYSFYNERFPHPFVSVVERNEELIADIEKRCKMFWGAVESRTPIGFNEAGQLTLYPIRPSCFVVLSSFEYIKNNYNKKLWLPIKVKPESSNESFIFLAGDNHTRISEIRKLNPNHEFTVISTSKNPFSVVPIEEPLEKLI